MINIEYGKAYCEVLEIIKYIPSNDYKKIPKEKIKLFEKLADKNCRIEYDPNKTLEENKISKIGRAIIAILYRDYWSTAQQREKILIWQQREKNKLDIEKRNIYRTENILKKIENKNKLKIQQTEQITENKLPIKSDKNIFTKILKKIKSIFKF